MRVFYVDTISCDWHESLLSELEGRGHYVYYASKYAPRISGMPVFMIEDRLCDLFRESNNGVYYYDCIVSLRHEGADYLRNNIFPPINRKKLSVGQPCYNLFSEANIHRLPWWLFLSTVCGMIGCFNVFPATGNECASAKKRAQKYLSPMAIRRAFGAQSILPLFGESPTVLVSHMEASYRRKVRLAKYKTHNYVKQILFPFASFPIGATLGFQELVDFVKENTVNKLNLLDLRARMFPSRIEFAWYLHVLGWRDTCAEEMPMWVKER